MGYIPRGYGGRHGSKPLPLYERVLNSPNVSQRSRPEGRLYTLVGQLNSYPIDDPARTKLEAAICLIEQTYGLIRPSELGRRRREREEIRQVLYRAKKRKDKLKEKPTEEKPTWGSPRPREYPTVSRWPR